MAFTRVEPVEVHVRTDWFSGRPREITWGDERLPITQLAAIREEAAAYPVITGPRTLFEVETPRARLALTFQHRSRRWTIHPGRCWLSSTTWRPCPPSEPPAWVRSTAPGASI